MVDFQRLHVMRRGYRVLDDRTATPKKVWKGRLAVEFLI
jgi:hypothetical protein